MRKTTKPATPRAATIGMAKMAGVPMRVPKTSVKKFVGSTVSTARVNEDVVSGIMASLVVGTDEEVAIGELLTWWGITKDSTLQRATKSIAMQRNVCLKLMIILSF